jgi:hypothetical protein
MLSCLGLLSSDVSLALEQDRSHFSSSPIRPTPRSAKEKNSASKDSKK